MLYYYITIKQDGHYYQVFMQKSQCLRISHNALQEGNITVHKEVCVYQLTS